MGAELSGGGGRVLKLETRSDFGNSSHLLFVFYSPGILLGETFPGGFPGEEVLITPLWRGFGAAPGGLLSPVLFPLLICSLFN